MKAFYLYLCVNYDNWQYILYRLCYSIYYRNFYFKKYFTKKYNSRLLLQVVQLFMLRVSQYYNSYTTTNYEFVSCKTFHSTNFIYQGHTHPFYKYLTCSFHINKSLHAVLKQIKYKYCLNHTNPWAPILFYSLFHVATK